MALIRFVDHRFGPAKLKQIEQANGIISELSKYRLTLRQLYYQFVARGLIANSQKNYKNLGDLVIRARRAGLIDWNSIQDIGRYIRGYGDSGAPQEVIETSRDSYHPNPWNSEFQKNYVECWVEKDALIGVVGHACQHRETAHFSCRGYTSDTAVYEASGRLARRVRRGQHPVILHFGDHDPSGIDMTRDILDRLRMFMAYHGYRERLDYTVRRMALNMEQVEAFGDDIPPNPAKVTDSRYEGYVRKFGEESWELDAMPVADFDKLIRDGIEGYVDADGWTAWEKKCRDGNEFIDACLDDIDYLEVAEREERWNDLV